MRLAVIFTGGTIGSQKQENGWIAPNADQPYRLLEYYYETYSKQAEGVVFECIMPYQILSENLDAEHLMLLIETIQEQLHKEFYDGIVVCHGTDTLQYSAAMLNYVFADIKLPLLLVSSNYPLEDSRANGLMNFYYAVETAQKNLRGTFVVYRNSDGNTYVHKGNRLLAHQTFEDDVYSVHHEYVGVYDKEGNWTQTEAIDYETEKIPYHGLQSVTNSILWLRVYPGMVYPELSTAVKAVLIESYHSGTIAIQKEIEIFAEAARKASIPIYLTGAVSDTSGYETIRNYNRLGIKVLENEAPIAVYCRLWLELSGR